MPSPDPTAVPAAPASAPPTIARLQEVADCVRDGECILFLGRGSINPPPAGSPYVYPEDQRPPLGGALARHLAEKCGLLAKYPW